MPLSPHRPAYRPDRRSLLAAFVAVICLFILSTTFSEYTARTIDDSAAEIARNAAPAIQHLEAARSELRHLELLLEHYLDAREAGRPADRSVLDASWREVQGEYARYNAIRYFPGEQPLSAGLNERIIELQGALSRLFLEDEQGRFADARRVQTAEVEPISAQLLADSVRLVEFNNQQAEALAAGIEKARDRSTMFAFALDAVSGLLALIIGYLAFKDVRRNTDLLEERNRLAERRAEELEEFAGRVAHDVVGPLMAVGLSMELTEKLPPDSPKREEVVGRGKSALRRVKLIVDGLLEFARSGAHPDPEAHARLDAVVEELFAELKPQTDALSIELKAEPPLSFEVACSPGVLTSVLSNLVRNAIKYMGDRDERRIVVRAGEGPRMVRIEVEDTGPGLPPGLGMRVFEPYVRGKGQTQPGIGLGLATVKRIAQAHGGSVSVKSEPGHGARFTVELPLYVPPPVLLADSAHPERRTEGPKAKGQRASTALSGHE